MELAVDTETTGTDFFHGCRPFLISACDGETNYWFKGSVNCYTREVFWDDEVLEEVQQLIDSCSKLIFHNTQFDMRALESIGLDISKWWDKIEDTLVAAHALCSGDVHGLKDLAIKYLHYFDDDEKELEEAIKAIRPKAAAKGWDTAKEGHSHFPALKGAVSWWKQDMWLAQEECIKYALCDVERTYLLWQAFHKGLIQENLYTPYKTRKKLLKVCYDITTHGMRLNVRDTKEHIENLTLKMRRIRKYIEKEIGMRIPFSWNKRDHLILLIHKELGIPILYTTPNGGAAVDKKALASYFETYGGKMLNALMKGRKLETELRYVQSYLRWTDDNGYIHSNLNVTGTRETRQSSTAPNQQNITGKLKLLFEPPPGKVWVEMDFANIELRIWAFAIKNEELMAAFASGISVHLLIMKELYPREHDAYVNNPDNFNLGKLYRRIKAGNFALIYGATEKKSDETYGFSGATNKIYRRFPGVAEYTQTLIRQCETNSQDLNRFAVYTLGNYLLDVPPNEPFKACNYYVQGSAGYLMTLSMLEVVKNPHYIEHDCHIVTQVHDSLKPEIPINSETLKTIYSIADSMETASMGIFGPTPVDFKLSYHKDDLSNSHLQNVIEAICKPEPEAVISYPESEDDIPF